MKPAIVLLSGGLDSATVLALAQAEHWQAIALSFHYGQRHAAEVRAARNIASAAGVKEHKIVPLDLTVFGGSALTDTAQPVPTGGIEDGIPPTYVPARNTIFLSLALAFAEVRQVGDIFIGVNAVDYSGYPDCRPEFIESFEATANLATRLGIEGRRVRLHTPLLYLSKAEIIKVGQRLGVDYAATVSCYQLNDALAACGVCDSCRIRAAGFAAAEVPDPTVYQ